MRQHIRVTRVLRDLIAAPPAEVEASLGSALASVTDLLGGGRSWLFLTGPDGRSALCHASDATELPGPATLSDLPRLQGMVQLTSPAQMPELTDFLTTQGVARAAVALLGPADAPLGLLCCDLPAEADEACIEFIGEFAATLAEVLSRARAHLAHADTAARLEATLQALPDLLFEVDSNGCYTGFSGGPRHLMLTAPGQFTGREIGSVLPPDAAEAARSAFRRVQQDGQVRDLVFSLDLPDGRHVFDVSGARLPPSDRTPAPAAVFLIRDVTQAHEMKEELRRLGSITRAMSNLVAITDTDLRITWVNHAFEMHNGWALDEIRGQSLSDLVRCPESDPAVVAALNAALARHEPFSGQLINRDRHGSRYHVEFNVLPLLGSNGDVQGFVSVETVVTQLKEQQAALERLASTAAAAQARLENALNALPDGVMVFDADERLLACNPAHVQTFPQLADVLVPGLHLRDLMRIALDRGLYDLPEGATDPDAFIDGLMADYRQPSLIDEYRAKDGRWFRRVNNRTADGGLIAVMLDITARHNHLEALDAANLHLKVALTERALAEQRLYNIMDWTRVGTWELDLDRDRVTVCRQWAQLLGMDHDSLTDMSHGEFMYLVHPDDRPMLANEAPPTRGPDPEGFEHEFRLRHADGHWVWVLSRGRIVGRSASGRPRQFVGVDIDISDQKRLEAEIRQSDAYLTSAMESSVAAIAIYDDHDMLVYCNSEAEEILRLKPGLFYGRRLDEPLWTLETLDGAELPLDQGPCNMARRAGTILRDIRFAVRWSDGRRQVLTCNATPVDTGDGRRNTVISFWDITDQLIATERLQEALAHAEEMSKAKSIFLANMSHEIRTPLNGVLGLAEVLSMQITDPEHSRMIATIRRSGETLLTVLNSILDMSKIEAGKMEIENVPLVLHDLLEQIDAVYSIQAAERDLDFDIITSTGVDLARIGDPHRIQQILHNLLSNAIKFSHHGSVTLTVSCRADRPVVFEVRDTGVGMTADQCARAFRSFEQADGSTTRRFGGTGLGLSIVRELVSLMQGEITLHSTPGEGTTVRVTLPLPMAAELEGIG